MMEKEDIKEFFKLELAGKKIEVECRNRRVFNECRGYLGCFDAPDFVIAATNEDIDYERELFNAEQRKKKHQIASLPDECLEITAVYRLIAEKLLDDGILLFHGAAIAVDGKCYLFMANSGVGKTTHIKNWLQVIPGSFVVNGDKPLIDMLSLQVYGTPWCGKEKLGTNTHIRLSGLVLLERGEQNTIEPISFREALPGIILQCHIPFGAEKKTYSLLGHLRDVPCYHLKCNMEPESAKVSYCAIHRR